jgi:phosphoesterase RecJ-like protein
MKIVQDIAQFIRTHDRFVLTSHVRPDGDSIGSQLALASAIEQLGKHVAIFDADPYPPNYRSLPGIERIRIGEPVKGDFDALIVLECSNLERAGVEGLDSYPSVNIDHHPVNDSFGVLNWVDPGASAVGEMLYELLTELGTDITFRVASRLVAAGAHPAQIAQAVLMSQSEARIRLVGKLLDTLEFDPSRKIAWVRLDRDMFVETGAAPNDTEGLANYPLSIDGVELCAFFREEGPNEYRVSFRSQGDFNVGRIAARFDGGGHRNAAGATLHGSFEEVRRRAVDALKGLLASDREEG